MDAETQSQINDLVQLREAHRRRKQHLDVQIAIMGIAADPYLSIEAESIEANIVGIESSLARLRLEQARQIASILPNDLQGNITDVDLHERLNAIGNYVLGVESTIHKEIGSMLRLVDTHNLADEGKRVNRQKRVDLIYWTIIILLFLNIIVLLLK